VPIEPGDAERAGELARRSAQRRRVLTVADAELELPPLDTAEHIRQAAEKIQRWAVGGLIPGVVTGACIRACEIALRAVDSELSAKRWKALEERVGELEQAKREGREWEP